MRLSKLTSVLLPACLSNDLNRLALGTCWLVALFGLISLSVIPQTATSTPQAGPPASWVSQVAALSGQAPKLNTAPLIQLDTSNKYYKTVIDGMMTNFKKAVGKASERAYTLRNTTSSKPISVVGNVGQQQQQKVTINDLHIDGINNPKISNIYITKKNALLHVSFLFKTIRVAGRCSSGSAKKDTSQLQSNILLEATNWNTSWSASVMQMIGRDHFDLSKVYTTHGHQRLSLNLKECPQTVHDELKASILERVRTTIDARLLEIMETVIMHTETIMSAEETSSELDQLAIRTASNVPKGRGKRASKQSPPRAIESTKSSPKKTNPITKIVKSKQQQKKVSPVSSATKTSRSNRTISSATKSRSRSPQQVGLKSSPRKSPGKALKRTKRQTPCQQGEELDDYVDQLFRFGTRLVRAMEPITLPNATIELPDYNLKIFLYEGKGTRAYKFRRAKPAWVFCNNETVSLGVTIEVEELRVAYKYRVISGTRLIFDGDLEARLSPKAQAQFSQAIQDEDSEEPVQQRVDRVRLFRLGKVFVLIRGLGNLTQSLSMIINGYLNDNQEELQPTFRMFEGDAVRLLNRFLTNFNVPILSVVGRRA